MTEIVKIEERHRLKRGTDFDKSLSIKEPYAEFSIDMSSPRVDIEEIVDDIKMLVEKYNQKPSDFEEWNVSDWDRLTVNIDSEEI